MFQVFWLVEILISAITALSRYATVNYFEIHAAQQSRLNACTMVRLIITLFGTSWVFVTIFQCHPVKSFWNGPGVCVPNWNYFVAYRTCAITLQLATVCVSLYTDKKLDSWVQYKRVLTLRYMLEAFVFVSGIISTQHFANSWANSCMLGSVKRYVGKLLIHCRFHSALHREVLLPSS